MRGLSGRTLFLLAVVAAAVGVGVYVMCYDGTTSASTLRLADIPFPGAAAYEDLKELCAIGPRFSGSPGMAKQQELLKKHFEPLVEKTGGKVRLQEFRVREPRDPRQTVAMANLIVEWFPDRKERILLCTHYDTRPFPDEDKRNPKGVFVGANDGASGTAILMELGHAIPTLGTRYGIDFVFLDGEEYVFNKSSRIGAGDPMFLGAEFFARDYATKPPPYQYRWGVLLDMVGSANLRVFQERNSVGWADTRPLVYDIWGVAKQIGVREFVPRAKYVIEDDHLSLHDVGKIPTCDIIDFDYMDYWHTEQDTPAHCSALSLAKVGWVMQEWLKQVK